MIAEKRKLFFSFFPQAQAASVTVRKTTACVKAALISQMML